MNIVETLQEIRKIPRRMHKSYLEPRGILSLLEKEFPSEDFPKFDTRNKIDGFLLGGKDALPKCFCGNFCKPESKYCSPKCTGTDPEFISRISEIQRNNKVERAQKSKQTYLKKYGVIHNTHIPKCIEARAEKRKLWSSKIRSETFSNYGLDVRNFDTPEKLQTIIDSHLSLNELSENGFGGMPVMTMCRYINQFDVKMYEKTTSGSERELVAFVRTMDDTLITGNRTIIKPFELDIHIPNRNLAIEMNGNFWHSSKAGVDKNYHKKKMNLANSVGYDLIQIFEDEWLTKKEIVKSIISARLGFSEKIHARKCIIKEVPKEDAKNFFELNHLQGNSSFSFAIGLYKDENLVSCISIGKSRFSKEADFELIRYATLLDHTIVGGFSKMLKKAKSLIENEKLLTYCDLRYSSGNTYSKFGVEVRTTVPGYFWTKNNVKIPRYKTMKTKLEKLVPKHYDPALTENEIMEAAGYAKLYDCGHKVFIL